MQKKKTPRKQWSKCETEKIRLLQYSLTFSNFKIIGMFENVQNRLKKELKRSSNDFFFFLDSLEDHFGGKLDKFSRIKKNLKNI